MLTQDYLKSILHYDPATGIFRWRSSGKGRTSTHGLAGSSFNYVTISIGQKKYGAHQLAWLYMTGKWAIEIDHENRNKLDNRFNNLVETNRSLNMLNTGNFAHNTSGAKGVIQLSSGKWRARLAQKNLGHFNTKDEAIAARAKAENEARGLGNNNVNGTQTG